MKKPATVYLAVGLREIRIEWGATIVPSKGMRDAIVGLLSDERR